MSRAQLRRYPTPEDAKRRPPKRDPFDVLVDRVIFALFVSVVVLIGVVAVHSYAVWITAR